MFVILRLLILTALLTSTLLASIDLFFSNRSVADHNRLLESEIFALQTRIQTIGEIVDLVKNDATASEMMVRVRLGWHGKNETYYTQ